MKQYSTLWGTSAGDRYGYLWSNPRLLDFLKKLGAPDQKLAANKTLSILRAFKDYPDYGTQPTDDKPVSAHYAPMHLYKLPEFPVTMRPFAAFSVTGSENRLGGRNSTYTHTVFLPIEVMRGGDSEYNFLDVMFGTPLTTWQQVEAFREGRSNFQPDSPPAKVEPEFHDLETALYAASVLIESKGEKNIILRLEKGYGFNRRAFELLKQIYSLLPPRLATETGFATYHPVENIDELSKRNSIQVFVLPAEAEIRGLDQNKNIVLDLSDEDYEVPLRRTPLIETLIKWSQMPWARRYAAYNYLFASEEINYQDSKTYIELSVSFLKSAQGMEAWLASEDNEGCISSLQDLEKLFADHPDWAKIPWGMDSIKEAMPDLLAEDVELSSLLAQSVATCRFTGDAEEMQKEFSRYQLGNLFEEPNIIEVCDTVAEKQRAKTKAEDKLIFDELAAKHTAAIAAKDSEIARQKAAHAQEKQDLSNLHAQELQKKDVAYSQMEQRLTGECRDVKTQLAEEKESRRAEKAVLEGKLRESNDSNLALQDKLSRKEAALSDAAGEIEKLRFAEKNATSALKKEREEHQLTRNSLEQAQEDLRKAERYSSYSGSSDDRPHFLRGLPWWMPLVAMLLVGALLVGAVWLIVSLTGGSDEAEPPVTVETADTTKPTETTTEAPPETEPSTEPTESTTESTEPPTTEEQPDPDYEFSNWTDPEAVHQLQLAFPELQLVETANIEGYCPEQWQDYCAAQVVFTLDEALPEVEVTDEEPTAETDEETEEETTDETEEETAEETDTAPQANYAVLLQGEMPEDEIVFAEPVAMVLQYGENILLVYGSDEMCTTSVQVLNYVLPEEDIAVPEETEENTEETEEETEEETSESVDETENTPIAERFLLRVDAETMVELTPDMVSWRNVGLISTNANDLYDGQSAFNSLSRPVLRLDTEETSFYLYDYREKPEKVEQFIEILEDDFTVIAIGDFVLVIQ